MILAASLLYLLNTKLRALLYLLNTKLANAISGRYQVAPALRIQEISSAVQLSIPEIHVLKKLKELRLNKLATAPRFSPAAPDGVAARTTTQPLKGY